MSQPAAPAASFRRITIDRYAIVLTSGHKIGEVIKARSVDHRGRVNKPVWVASAEAAHPFGVARAEHLRGRTRREAAARAVTAYQQLCVTAAELCRIHMQQRAA